MKPICAACNLFFRMKHQGEYFEEGMPGPNGAKRELVDSPLLVEGISLDADTVFQFTQDDIRVKPGQLEGWQSYKLWVGDLWECRGCGAQIIVGFGNGPISEHYKDDYQDTKARLGVTRRIDDC